MVFVFMFAGAVRLGHLKQSSLPARASQTGTLPSHFKSAIVNLGTFAENESLKIQN